MEAYNSKAMVLTGFQAAAGNFLRNVLAPAVSQNYLIIIGVGREESVSMSPPGESHAC